MRTSARLRRRCRRRRVITSLETFLVSPDRSAPSARTASSLTPTHIHALECVCIYTVNPFARRRLLCPFAVAVRFFLSLSARYRYTERLSSSLGFFIFEGIRGGIASSWYKSLPMSRLPTGVVRSRGVVPEVYIGKKHLWNELYICMRDIDYANLINRIYYILLNVWKNYRRYYVTIVANDLFAFLLQVRTRLSSCPILIALCHGTW